MKYSTLSIASIILAFSLGNAHAADYETAHTFVAGELLSSDLMNENFDKIKTVTAVATESDFIGSWDVTQTTCRGGGPGGCSQMLTMQGMVDDNNGITRSRTDTVTFTSDGDGTFSFSQATYASFIRSGGGNIAGMGDFAIINGMGIFSDAGNGSGMFDVRLVSPTRINLHIFEGGSVSYNIISLDKRATPPTNPTRLVVVPSLLVNLLSWNDNSVDESGFKVFKKSSLAGAWTQVGGMSGADATGVTDTVLAAGDYWYRVKASHSSNGDSIGSNVVKVTNSN